MNIDETGPDRTTRPPRRGVRGILARLSSQPVREPVEETISGRHQRQPGELTVRLAPYLPIEEPTNA